MLYRLLSVALVIAASSAAQANEACRATAGLKFAERLAGQCVAVSPATSPPCHVENSCDMIIGAIRHGCVFINDGAEYARPEAAILKDQATEFCKDYLDIAGEVSPSFDCAKAASVAEKAICADNELSALDTALAAAFTSAVQTEATTRSEQRAWLKGRDTKCGAPAAEAERKACLRALITQRIEDLRLGEQGLQPGSAEVRALTYGGLIGTWQVRSVRTFGDGVQALVDDDAQYMGAIVVFEAGAIRWVKGGADKPVAALENCSGQPHLTPVDASPGDASYAIPGGYIVRCQGGTWGPGSGAVVQAATPDAVRLYWYDDGILTLRRQR